MALSKRQQGRVKHQFQTENKAVRDAIKESLKNLIIWLAKHLPDLITLAKAIFPFIQTL